MKKNFVSLLLTAAMAISLAACGGKEPDNGQASSGGASRSDAAKDSDAGTPAEDGPLTPFADTVTLEVALMINSGLNYEPGDDITNNPWIRGYKDKLNIEVVPAYTAEWDDYFTKINFAIADKKLPDVCMVQTYQLQQMIEADLLYDMTEIYDKYASDIVNGYIAIEPESLDS